VKNGCPDYEQVKNWAYNVADGYDTRATLNRQAIYGGGLTALAATGALVGLAAFDPESPVITGIPIGTTFLAGTMALYNNEQKAVIYGSASQTIRDVLIQSDCRVANNCVDKKAAVCLHAEVSDVMRKVNDHITLLDPKNVADMLKAVASSIAAKEATVEQKRELVREADAALEKAQEDKKQADAALEKAQEDKEQADAALTRAKKAAASALKAQAVKDAADVALKKAQEEADAAREAQAAQMEKEEKEAEKKAADTALKNEKTELQAAQEKNTVQKLSDAANNFDDLKVVPNFCTDDTTLCKTPPACQLRK